MDGWPGHVGQVFDGCEYHSLSSLSSSVPVLEVGGIAKQYMVPGWRVGWALVHDRDGKMHQVTSGRGGGKEGNPTRNTRNTPKHPRLDSCLDGWMDVMSVCVGGVGVGV